MTSDVTVNDVTESISKRFLDNFGDLQTTLDPENFTPPTIDPQDAAASSWIRLSIRHTTASQWTLGQIGNRKFQRKGLIIGQIFTPLNIGRQLSDQLVQRFKDVFEGVNFDAVECYTANVKEMVTEGLWFPVAVQVDFNYNELK